MGLKDDQNPILSNINKEITELQTKYSKSETDLAFYKSNDEAMEN